MNSTKQQPGLNNGHSYESSWQCGEYRIIQCQSCGFNHLYPLPDPAELELFYKDRYYREIKPFPYEKADERFIQEKTSQIMQYPRFAGVYNQVASFKQTDCQVMLDIGCGNNLLVKYFQNKQWQVYAIEPSKDAAGYLARFGIEVLNRRVEEIDFNAFAPLAFVNIQFVLEHMTDPLAILQKLWARLVPGGIIRIGVPNDFSPGQLAYAEYAGEDYDWVHLPDHINYFTFDSLNALLSKAGFREVYRTTNFPLEFLLLSGIRYYENEADRQKVKTIVANFEAAFKQTGRGAHLTGLYESLAQLGFGRSVYMYAIKE